MVPRPSHASVLILALFLAAGAAGCGPALTAAGIVGIAALQNSRNNMADTPPAVSVTTPSGAVNDTVGITYRLIDIEVDDRADVTVEFSQDGGSTFQTASQAFVEGAEGTTNLTTSDTGVDHTFFWNTAEDLGALNVTGVQVRVTVRPAGSDGDEGSDTATTEAFDVLNRFMTTLAAQATALELLPTAMTLNSAGDLYLTDAAGHRVLRVSKSTGVSTVLAGTGTAGFEEGNLNATSAQLNLPIGIGVDAQGDVLVADFLNAALRRVQNANGFITVLGGQGSTQDEGELATDTFFLPRDLALDSKGNAYLLTEDHEVRVINLAGTGSLTFSFGTTTCTTLPAASISLGPEQVHSLVSGDPNCGVGASAYTQRIDQGRCLALEETGTELVAYIIDIGNFGGGGTGGGQFPKLLAANLGTTAVSRFSLKTSSMVSIPPGDGVLLADGALIKNLGNSPDLAVGANGVLLISSTDSSRITAVNVQTTNVQVAAQSLTPGQIVTVLGNGTFGLEGDGLVGTAAQLFFPTAVTGDAQGNVYVGEANGRVRVVAGSSGLTFAGQNVAAGRVGTLPAAVPGTSPAAVTPQLVAQNRGGPIYFTDSAFSDPRSNRVLRLDPQTGALTSVLGSGLIGDSGDGGPAELARVGLLGSPAVSPDGSVLCVPDLTHHRIRAVNLTPGPLTFLGVTIAPGAVETVAGVGQVTSGTTIPLGDGGAATAASLAQPVALDFDDRGLLWISDAGNDRIRVANPTQSSQIVLAATIAPDAIQTVVGTGTKATTENSGEAGPAGSADLTNPGGLLGADGNLYLAEDSSNGQSRVRVVNLGSTTITRGLVSVAPGAIATIAGSGQPRANDNSNLGDGGSALASSFRNVSGFSLANDLLLYLSDETDNRVRVVNLGAETRTIRGFALAPGIIDTAVGTGVPAFAGDPGLVSFTFNGGVSASPVDAPRGLLSYGDGRLVVLDSENGALRLANFSDGPQSLAGATASSSQLVIVAGERAGKVRAASPQDVRVSAQGRVIFSDAGKSGGSPAVLSLDPQTRVVTRIAGTGDRTAPNLSNLGDGGPALTATFGEVRGIDLDSLGNLYVCDATSRRIRYVNTSGSVQTPLAGVSVEPSAITTLLSGAAGDGDPNNDDGQSISGGGVDLFFPNSVGVASGAMWVVDEGSNRLLRIDTSAGTVAGVFSRAIVGSGSGTVLNSSGQTVLSDPGANFTTLGVEVGDLVQIGTGAPRVTGVLNTTTLALGTPPPAAPTPVNYSIQRDDIPLAVAAQSGTVAYLAVQSISRGGGRLLKLSYTGSSLTPTTIAGTGDPGWNGDLLRATNLRFGEVRGMFFANDLLYLADATNHRIVVINTGTSTQTLADLAIGPGEARTIAGGGQGKPGFNGDAIPPHLALLNRPSGVAVGPRNEVVLVDQGNGRVRRFER
jgi:NHL repeat-containing protein